MKHGKFIPGVNIPIVSKKKIKDKNSAILVLAWNFFDEIKKDNTNLSKLIKSTENNSLIIGSRYLKNSKIYGVNKFRIFLSKLTYLSWNFHLQ